MATSLSQRRPVWKPTPKQAEYLQAPEDEVLYGGAAGGGKTDAIIVDALGLWQNALENPRYRALLIRRTFPQLRDMIDRSRAVYPIAYPGAQYNESAKEWRFPSGAKVIFGYAENDSDRFQYQGQEFQFVGFEELTQWATDTIYRYLFSRLRSSDPSLKCLMRATCNPGGVGHKWVMDRWGIPATGAATRNAVREVIRLDDGEDVERIIYRRFIPAKVGDNPHLDISYRANLAQLSDAEKAQLLHGRWDVVDVPGQIYRAELQAAFEQNRLGRVPYDARLPVHTAWDLGMGDATSIVMWQQNGREVWVIDYYEASGEGLAHYVQVLQSRGYVWGTHWAPHDIRVRELGTGKSRIEVAASLGVKFEIVPQIGLDDGIEAVRNLFPRIWFDETKAARLIDCLRNYRKDYNQALGEFKPRPVHDWASHGADALRYMAVSIDDKPKRERKSTLQPSFGSGWMG